MVRPCVILYRRISAIGGGLWLVYSPLIRDQVILVRRYKVTHTHTGARAQGVTMGHATVPAPTEADHSTAIVAVNNCARRNGVDINAQGVHSMLVDHAAVLAQAQAEVRWLRAMVHLNTQGN
jgi:hypothetical protein